MSWGTCLNGSNNVYAGFPALMSDGRYGAGWQPEAVINNEIRKKENIKTNYQYRQYLQHNANEIMKMNNLESCEQCCACPFNSNDVKNTHNSPFLFTGCTDQAKPFGYEDSDLKSLYLSKQQLQARLNAPAMSQYQYLESKYANWN